jgi:RimJ/RimL family protein N-acetyltransferase
MRPVGATPLKTPPSPRSSPGLFVSSGGHDRHPNEFLGVAGVHRIGSPEPEVGIWIRETAHGRGYGRESIEAIVKWAPANIGAEAFIYPVVTQNHPSHRLAQSLHGSIVGARELRKSGGAVFDQVVYRIPAATSRC